MTDYDGQQNVMLLFVYFKRVLISVRLAGGWVDTEEGFCIVGLIGKIGLEVGNWELGAWRGSLLCSCVGH